MLNWLQTVEILRKMLNHRFMLEEELYRILCLIQSQRQRSGLTAPKTMYTTHISYAIFQVLCQ
jgi:hypothetical protein